MGKKWFTWTVAMTLLLTLPMLLSIQDSHAAYVENTGAIDNWLENSSLLELEGGIQIAWSLADANSGWFYGFDDDTSVARVSGVDSFEALAPASSYAYRPWAVGPVREGDIVLFNNSLTGYYAALYVEDFSGTGKTGGTFLQGFWQVSNDGLFPTPVPLPGAFLLIASGLAIVACTGKKVRARQVNN